jgi:hypothetical protein
MEEGDSSRTSGVKIFFYIFLTVIGLSLIGLAVFLYFFQVPGECESLCPSYMNGPGCHSVLEKFKDATIPTPTPAIYLTKFIKTDGVAPFCLPVWYAFRYVRNDNGGYSPLSQWSGYRGPGLVPTSIYSGAKTFPCPPGGCIGIKYGQASCDLNQPTLELYGKLDVNIDISSPQYTLNVHRQMGTGFDKDGNPTGFDPTSEGEIVGYFILGTEQIFFTDIFFNPNTTNSTSCC